MTQTELFERPPSFADARLDTAERPRLNRQCLEILKHLLDGAPCSNGLLSRVALRYSARIFDIKAAGIAIMIVDRDKASGETWYALANSEDRQRAQEYFALKLSEDLGGGR